MQRWQHFHWNRSPRDSLGDRRHADKFPPVQDIEPCSHALVTPCSMAFMVAALRAVSDSFSLVSRSQSGNLAQKLGLRAGSLGNRIQNSHNHLFWTHPPPLPLHRP